MDRAVRAAARLAVTGKAARPEAQPRAEGPAWVADLAAAPAADLAAAEAEDRAAVAAGVTN